MKYVLKTSKPSRPRFDPTRDLNPQQRAVVEAPPLPLLVIAGAGSGKTRTLIYRVARFVQEGCPPDRILLCTFTNRAAKEMVSRVEATVGIDMSQAGAGTFHHIGHKLLRRYGEHVGLGLDFGILDPEDARSLLTSVIAEQGLEKLSARRFPQPKVLSSMIGLAGSTLTPLAEVIAQRAPKLVPQLPAIEDTARRYAERKRANNIVDFNDLITLWHRLLVDPACSEVADELQGAYDHVLVDEYQDVTALQGSLCDQMASRCGSLTAVGDDAQSIYGFRGADFEQIAAFERRHPGGQVLKLTTNYRSTPEILDLANRSIGFNRRQHFKELNAVNNNGMVPALIPLRDVYQQAEFVAQRVLEIHHEQNLPLRKMAVLYRNHAHSLELQVELTRRQIPYSIRSGVKFFEQAHIKDVVAYLRARENPRDELAWLRLLRQWPGVGVQTAEALSLKLAGHDPQSQRQEPAEILLAHAQTARGQAKGALTRLGALWNTLHEPEQRSPGAAIKQVVEEHYREFAERSFTNADARKEDLEHLAEYADRFGGPEAFLSELALVQGITAENVVSGEEPDDKLVLTTVHQAKGLEWPICFMIWMADGRFPSAVAMRSPMETEEERRLFYVAATRAKSELYMLYPTIEEARDGPSRMMRPSKFLVELDRSPRVFERWQIMEEPLDGAQ
ncbi:MAG: ATP-dependent helicase [Nannocystaceae bacterium]|nr:ATP-dependent helicase [Nannocystaceae bacterium]